MFIMVLISGLFFLASDYIGYLAIKKIISKEKENGDIVLWLVLKTFGFLVLAYMSSFIK